MTPAILQISIVFGWIHAFTFYGILLSPITSTIYSANTWGFAYDFSFAYTEGFIKAAFIISHVHLAMCGVWYIVLGVKHARAVCPILDVNQLYIQRRLLECAALRKQAIHRELCLTLQVIEIDNQLKISIVTGRHDCSRILVMYDCLVSYRLSKYPWTI